MASSPGPLPETNPNRREARDGTGRGASSGSGDRYRPRRAADGGADGRFAWHGRGGRPPLVGAGRGGTSAADGGPGRHDREYSAAFGPARPGVLQRRPAVGGDGVLPGIRQPAAARRPTVGPRWPAADAD